MFRICRDRILIGGASIGFPERLYLTGVMGLQEAVVFTDMSKSFYLKLNSRKTLLDLKSVISNDVYKKNNTIITDIAPFTQNGMSGFYAVFKKSGKECYKAVLRKGTCFSEEYLEVLIIAGDENAQIETIMKKTEIKSFFCDIREE